jgi:hypothetical protein
LDTSRTWAAHRYFQTWIVTPTIGIAEARLTLVAALAFHAQTAFRADFTESPIAELVGVAVL